MTAHTQNITDSEPRNTVSSKMSHKSNENVNVNERPLSKRKKKSAFDPYYVYYSSASNRKPLTVSQPISSTANQLESTSNSKRLKQSLLSRHLAKDSSRREQKKNSGNLSKSTFECLSKNAKQKEVPTKQKSTDQPSPSVLNFCQISCNNVNVKLKQPVVGYGQLNFTDTFRNTEDQPPKLLNQKDSSKTVKKKVKESKVKENCSKSTEKDRSKFQRGGTNEVTTKEVKLDDSNPQTNNTRVLLQQLEELKTVYTSRLIDGRIKITRKSEHDKTVQKESVESNESDRTKQIEVQTINDDIIRIENEAQVSPELCDAGVQTDLPKRNKLCDFSCQTMFPDAISESLSSVSELRRRISELEQSLTQSKKINKAMAAIYQQKIDGCDRRSQTCNELPSNLIQGPFNQLEVNLTTVQCQSMPSSSSLHGIQHTLQSTTTTPQPINLRQLPTSRILSTNSDSREEATSYSFMPRPEPCITTMCVPTPQTPSMIVSQQFMVRPNVEIDSLQQGLSPFQSSILYQQRYTHPLKLSVFSTHQNQTWHTQHCACRQCFHHRQQQISLLLQNGSQLSSTSSEESLEYQSLHQNESVHQQLRQQRLAQQHQQHVVRQHLLRQNLHEEQLRHQELVQRHVLMQRIETERLEMVRLEKEWQEYMSSTNHVRRR